MPLTRDCVLLQRKACYASVVPELPTSSKVFKTFRIHSHATRPLTVALHSCSRVMTLADGHLPSLSTASLPAVLEAPHPSVRRGGGHQGAMREGVCQATNGLPYDPTP